MGAKGVTVRSMAVLPRPTKYSKVGSNLKRRKAVAAFDEALRKRRIKPFLRAERKFQRQRRAILTKPAVRNAAEVFRHHRDAYDLAFLKANGNGVKIDRSRRRAQAAIDRALRVRIPKFAKYEALRQQYALDYRGLVANHLLTNQVGALGVQLGDVRPDDVIFQPFTPPYELFDVTAIAGLSSDNSFADPDSGNLVTDIRYLNDDSTFTSFKPVVVSENRSSVGINFRVPKTGFLNCTAVIQNLFNRFVYGLKNKFGFSSGEIDVQHTIFVTIVRFGEVTRREHTMFANGLVALDGSEFTASGSPISTSTPFTISFAFRDAFLKGEQIQILVGAAVCIQSRVDDMEAFATAVTQWQLKTLAVAMRT